MKKRVAIAFAGLTPLVTSISRGRALAMPVMDRLPDSRRTLSHSEGQSERWAIAGTYA
jgi:hypothetical protein